MIHDDVLVTSLELSPKKMDGIVWPCGAAAFRTLQIYGSQDVFTTKPDEDWKGFSVPAVSRILVTTFSRLTPRV